MKAVLKGPLILAGKDYAKGLQDLPDAIYSDAEFQKRVKAGDIQVQPRDEQAQAVQADKDARAMQKAVDAKEIAQAEVDARAARVNQKVIAG